jgi:hypothetical protein
MTAKGKITTTEIGRRTAARTPVRILVYPADASGYAGIAYRKTGAVHATVTGFNAVSGGRQVRYDVVTDHGTVRSCFGAQTHYLAPEPKTTPAETAEETTGDASAPATPDPAPTAAPNAATPVTPGETFEHQASTDGGKMWRTVAVGLDPADVDQYRAANEAGEGIAWRILPEHGDDRARAIAAKAAELTAARTRFHAESNRTVGGSSRTKQFGRRIDGQLKRAGELSRLIDRLARELDALRRPVRAVPPLDLTRLPFATHIRTKSGWYEVVRVNRKTVKVVVDPGWDDLVPMHRIEEIHERRAAKAAEPAAPSAEPFVSGWADQATA